MADNHKEKVNKQFKESFAGMDAVMQDMSYPEKVRFMNKVIHELRVKITIHANWCLENLAGLDHRDFIFNKENAPKIFNCLWEKNFISMIEAPENQVYGLDFDAINPFLENGDIEKSIIPDSSVQN
ncbi:MAG: hypothetical protein DDT19_00026 [Syntrophomonadaceae bacterium]|nr:hypothetical protein [Bacillota bacterium]